MSAYPGSHLLILQWITRLRYVPNMYCKRSVVFVFVVATTSTPYAAFSACQDAQRSMTAEVFREQDARECSTEDPSTLQAFVVRENEISSVPSTSFQVNDRVAICVTLDEAGYVSIWDAPPNGERERLFPNGVSHPSGAKAALMSVGKTCIGKPNSGYGIRIPPQDGIGKGQFYLLITETYAAHLEKDAFLVTGFMRASVFKEETTTPIEQPELVEDRFGYSDTWLVYEVRE